ncbi:MAG TPA: hypothetical protein VMW52_03790 [Phycisphaerae bacterium]|nr:hypothetical protein [Phycisphaerae bacterium]
MAKRDIDIVIRAHDQASATINRVGGLTQRQFVGMLKGAGAFAGIGMALRATNAGLSEYVKLLDQVARGEMSKAQAMIYSGEAALKSIPLVGNLVESAKNLIKVLSGMAEAEARAKVYEEHQKKQKEELARSTQALDAIGKRVEALGREAEAERMLAEARLRGAEAFAQAQRQADFAGDRQKIQAMRDAMADYVEKLKLDPGAGKRGLMGRVAEMQEAIDQAEADAQRKAAAQSQFAERAARNEALFRVAADRQASLQMRDEWEQRRRERLDAERRDAQQKAREAAVVSRPAALLESRLLRSAGTYAQDPTTQLVRASQTQTAEITKQTGLFSRLLEQIANNTGRVALSGNSPEDLN